MQEQQHRPRFLLIRRVIFPFSGEEPLTRAQSARVILSWSTIFPIILTIGTLPILAVFGQQASVERVALLILLTFLISVCLFSALAAFVVFMVNRSARFFQQQKTQQSASTSNSSGGRYGS